MEKIDLNKILENVRTCINKNDVKYVEVLITPIRQGFKVEIYPEQGRLDLERIADCLSSELKFETLIKESVNGKVMIVNAIG